ncbi:phage shock protein C, PspC [Thermoanaerobacter kivui]|uniref:Phage shock protein C, PspC n=1 Tax=Thermoanaerobacter kivui TaxID=2325 RepID=A0A097AQF1_THEKI|nr:PspC domain-containing protein [Thermoanaerobacter kivui]AIS52064.1 phage shock protein C, PspC [Thermoanaerobacter kivui]
MSKRLYRSREQKMLGGVCGGIAEYFDIDVTLVRLICLLTIFSGIGILPYLVAWIVIPENPYQLKGKVIYEKGESEEFQSDNGEGETENKPNRANEFFGWFLVILGVVLLLDKLLSWFDFKIIWSILLIAIGIAILFKKT